MACRTYRSKEYCNLYSFLTFFFICVVCALFLYEFIIVEPEYILKIVVIVLFALIAFLVFASYFATSCTQPGKVPFFYGLTDDKNTTSLQKYCVACHNFKPERSHHCNSCRKCVMNMDHHCPWVNNCIGFHNRKYFLQFIGFLALGLLMISIIGIIFLIRDFKRVFQTQQTNIHFAIRVILTLFSITMFAILSSFFAFHFRMVLQNTTTLEGLIEKRNQQQLKSRQENRYEMGHKKRHKQREIIDIPDYDIGRMENFYQVFGENGFYWFLPLYGDGPKGNGFYWPKEQQTPLNTEHHHQQRTIKQF